MFTVRKVVGEVCKELSKVCEMRLTVLRTLCIVLNDSR